MFNIKFLGYGGAFDYRFGNSSAILNFNGKNILIDCGYMVYPLLCEVKMEMKIDYVLITHMHNDHTGSLSNYLLHYNILSGKRMKIIYPEDRLKKQLNEYLKFSLNIPSKYIEFVELKKIKGADYIDTYGKHVPWMQTYAYIFKDKNETLVYSGDLGDADFLFEELKKKNINSGTVFHDVHFKVKMKPHAFYKDVEKYCDDYRIIGYHHDPRTIPKNSKIKSVANLPEYLFDINFPLKFSREN